MERANEMKKELKSLSGNLMKEKESSERSLKELKDIGFDVVTGHTGTRLPIAAMKQWLQKNGRFLSETNALSFARCWGETVRGDVSYDTVVMVCRSILSNRASGSDRAFLDFFYFLTFVPPKKRRWIWRRGPRNS
eukprot:6293788-Amphidinium_carterae.1